MSAGRSPARVAVLLARLAVDAAVLLDPGWDAGLPAQPKAERYPAEFVAFVMSGRQPRR